MRDDRYTMWERHPDIWNTEAKFLGWIRGGIRRALWERHPVKLQFIQRRRIRIDNPNPKGKQPYVWGGVCALCNEAFPQAQLQVDHITGEHSLRHMEDLQKFIEGIVLVDSSELQWVCKSCHTIKSYAEKHGMSMAEAANAKEAIAVSKLPAKDVLTWQLMLKHEGPL